jgi:hypothetical protein
MDGLFIELGPFRVTRRGATAADDDDDDATGADGEFTVELSHWSWHKLGWIVFVDQPLGTGSSCVTVYRRSFDAVRRRSSPFVVVGRRRPSLFHRRRASSVVGRVARPTPDPRRSRSRRRRALRAPPPPVPFPPPLFSGMSTPHASGATSCTTSRLSTNRCTRSRSRC